MDDPVLSLVVELRNSNNLNAALVAAYKGLEANASNVPLRLLLVRTLWDLEIFSVARSECASLVKFAPDNVAIRRLAERLGITVNELSEADETIAEGDFLD